MNCYAPQIFDFTKILRDFHTEENKKLKNSRDPGHAEHNTYTPAKFWREIKHVTAEFFMEDKPLDASKLANSGSHANSSRGGRGNGGGGNSGGKANTKFIESHTEDRAAGTVTCYYTGGTSGVFKASELSKKSNNPMARKFQAYLKNKPKPTAAAGGKRSGGGGP